MEWTRGPVLGQGSSATVSVAATPSGDLFAVKSTILSSSSLLQKEKCIISQLNSPYIVKYLGYEITYDENKYNLFIEYAPSGTLSDLIKKHGGCFNESLIQSYTHRILQGLNHLHSNGIVHCDIKPQNILNCKDGLKIADFGCAKLMPQGDDPAGSGFSGTPVFMAPEVARGREQGFPADIWALGCTIVEMATGSNPWPGVHDPVSAVYRIGYTDDIPEIPPWFSVDAKEFLGNCLRREAKERWTAKELLQHPFLNGLKMSSKAVNAHNRHSPTSILNQDIWDSFEASEASPFPSTVRIVLSFTSLADRIGRLACLNLPNWTEEEDWTTVRSREEEKESSTFSMQIDVIETSVAAIEDYLFDYIIDEMIVGSIPDSDTDDFSMSSEIVTDDLVSSTIHCKCNKMKNSFCSVEILLQAYFSLQNLTFLEKILK